MSRQSTTLATTTRSTQMLRLTTSTPGIRSSLLQALAHKEKACFNVHIQFLVSTGKPGTGCHKRRKSNQELDNCQIRNIFGQTREHIADLAENNICELNKQWKLGILEQGMNSPDENKLYFTKNLQIENEHFVILVLGFKC